jgi:ATP-dependent Clp protease ATP-binding subunit ClpB
MRIDKLTTKFQEALGDAQSLALSNDNQFIEPEHLLLAMLRQQDGGARSLLTRAGTNVAGLEKAAEAMIAKLPQVQGTGGDVQIGRTLLNWLNQTEKEASKRGDQYIAGELFLLVLADDKGELGKAARENGLSRKALEAAIDLVRGGESVNSADAEGQREALKKYTLDLTERARLGKLDPVIGRDDEIRRAIQILQRRSKNNPVLIGEPGVGKTAIVEGLAQSIAKREVPEPLANKRIISLDLAGMVAGTKYRGQFEERIKAVMKEVKTAKNIILFVDELHTLVGAGGAEGAIDASNVLKPALSRGEMQCIGATTLDEYRKYIEKDGALERRFQQIIVDPPSSEDAVKILLGIRDKYETHHRVKITDAAITAAVKLSERYINGRFLPDKAIDVIDESGSRLRLKASSKVPMFKEVEAQIREFDKAKSEAVLNQDYEKAADFRDRAERKKKELIDLKKKAAEQAKEPVGTVDEQVIAEVVASMTGVPVTRLDQGEAKRLLALEDHLHKKVVSQHDAITAIARAIRRSRSGLKDPKRPTGSFMFVGPTGVGKTLLCKALAEFMFGGEDALIQIDMSEYGEKHNASRLVGAPPGYVGYEEGGQLTEKVRRRPYSVVLFDEIEKAHHDVFNLLLQIMEEGRITDSYGRAVDFRNTIVVMTSNVGAAGANEAGSLGFQTGEDAGETYARGATRKAYQRAMEDHFRPEFLNRLDDIVVFRPLERDDLKNVVQLEFNKVAKRMTEQGITLTLAEAGVELLLKEGFDPKFGARPIRRAIERLVEDPLGETLLRGEFGAGAVIIVDAEGEAKAKRIVFRRGEPAPTPDPVPG